MILNFKKAKSQSRIFPNFYLITKISLKVSLGHFYFQHYFSLKFFFVKNYSRVIIVHNLYKENREMGSDKNKKSAVLSKGFLILRVPLRYY